MKNGQQFAVGDRVQQWRFPWHGKGTVWSVEPDMVIVKWDDPDENGHIRDPSVLEKVSVRRERRASAIRQQQARREHRRAARSRA